MDEKLLKAFGIKETEEGYEVYAADEAYLLLNSGVPSVGKEHDTVEDKYYREAALYRAAALTYLASKYRIDGLYRQSNGNGHDASWVSEAYIFNSGYCPDALSSRIEKGGRAYMSSIIVEREEKITDEIIGIWAEEFDLDYNGEGPRIVYCSAPDDSEHFSFDLSLRRRFGTAAIIKRNYGRYM